MPSILKRAVTGFLSGLPLGFIMYTLASIANTAAGSTIIEPLIAFVIGEGTAIALQFVQDLKEEITK